MRGAGLLLLVVIAASSACASAGGAAAPRPFPRPGAPATPGLEHPAPAAGGATALALAATALELRGTPYRNGGDDPRGFDCSGFVRYVFARHGLDMPRTVGEQYQTGTPVSAPYQPGDLLFFTTIAPGASHVAIALGGDEFVHAPSSSGTVRVERLTAPYWADRFLGARRPLSY